MATRHASVSTALLGAFVVFACRSEHRAGNEPSTIAVPSASVTAPAPSTAVEQPAGVSKSDVRALVERWRDAQNRGDFEEYASFYGRTFTGVKRVGEKSRRFGRDGWLEDRKALFRKDVTVVVRDLHMVTGKQEAYASFVQQWSTPRFQDVGPKRLELRVEDGILRIVREEMLASETSKTTGSKAPPAEQLALLIPVTGGLGAVLGAGGIGGVGPTTVGPGSDDISRRVERRVSDRVAKPYASLVGRKMDLYRGATVACTGTVSGFKSVGGVVGGMTPNEPPEDTWQWIPDDFRYLVAVIEPDQADCAAQWARAADLPKPTLLRPRPLTDVETEQARKHLPETEMGLEVQRALVEQRRAEPGSAPRDAGVAKWPALQPRQWGNVAFDHPSQATYVVVELLAGPLCEDFTGYALGFFKGAKEGWIDVTGDGDPRSRLPHRPVSGLVPHTAVVLAEGERPYLVGDDVVYGAGPTGFVPVATSGLVRWVCSC